MRTTLTIDDVLTAAKEMAAAQHKSVGEVMSALARQAMRLGPARHAVRNGVPLLPVRQDAPRVTSELVRRLHEELQ